MYDGNEDEFESKSVFKVKIVARFTEILRERK